MNIAIGMRRGDGERAPRAAFSAFTTTSATTASRMIMMSSTVMSAVTPPTGPISSRAIWPSDLPSRRIEAEQDDEVLHAPPSTAPMMIHSVPGR